MTYIQDELLLANAAARLGEDRAAIYYADKALVRDSDRQAAIRTRALSLFNLQLEAETNARKEWLWHEFGQTLASLDSHDAATLFVAGLHAYRVGNEEKVRALRAKAVRPFGEEAKMGALALQAAEAESPKDVPSQTIRSIRKLIN